LAQHGVAYSETCLLPSLVVAFLSEIEEAAMADSSQDSLCSLSSVGSIYLVILLLVRHSKSQLSPAYLSAIDAEWRKQKPTSNDCYYKLF
jgi:hypothetical protein